MLILALESSTTSAKAMLYSGKDGVINLISKEYPPEINDTMTQDAEGVFMQLAEVGRQISAGRKIDCIVLSGIWHSVVLCDGEMKPQTRVMSWADTSAAQVCEHIIDDRDKAVQYYKKTGCLVNSTYPFFKLFYLKKQGYRLKDYYIFGQGSYNTYRLTGERVVTDCMASGTGLMNIYSKTYDKQLLDEIGIEEEQLCRIVTYKDSFPLSEEGARLLGLKAGVPVMAPCSDGALNQVGAGALKEGIATFSVGTSAAIRFTAKEPLIPDEPSTWCYLSPISYLVGAATSGACNCTDWFVDHFYDEGYGDIEKNCNKVSDTPVFLPFLFGERSPGWQGSRRGAFLGIEPHHKKEELYVAMLEGILFNVLQSYEVLCRLNGVPKKIILSGGILNSAFWTQMCADIFGVEMEAPVIKQSSLMGAVILSLHKLGVLKDIGDFPFEKGRIIRPDLTKSKHYAEKFKKYNNWYDKTK